MLVSPSSASLPCLTWTPVDLPRCERAKKGDARVQRRRRPPSRLDVTDRLEVRPRVVGDGATHLACRTSSSSSSSGSVTAVTAAAARGSSSGDRRQQTQTAAAAAAADTPTEVGNPQPAAYSLVARNAARAVHAKPDTQQAVSPEVNQSWNHLLSTTLPCPINTKSTLGRSSTTQQQPKTPGAGLHSPPIPKLKVLPFCLKAAFAASSVGFSMMSQ